jgi:hypothetical protein
LRNRLYVSVSCCHQAQYSAAYYLTATQIEAV